MIISTLRPCLSLPRWRLALLLLLAGAGVVNAQDEDGRYLVRNYTMREYGGVDQVWRAAQGPDGVMYFGNAHRVLVFDGETWNAIETPAEVPVRGVDVDATGRVWIGTMNNLGYAERDASGPQQFVSLLDRLPPDQRDVSDVWAAYAQPDGVYFANTTSVFCWQNGAFTTWRPAGARQIGLYRTDGHLAVYSRDQGFYVRQDGRWHLLSNDPWLEKNRSYSGIVHLPDGTWLIGSRFGGLARLSADGGTLTPVSTAADQRMIDGNVYCMRRLHDGAIAIGTLGRGLIILRPDLSVDAILDADTGLQDNTVFDVFEDRDGSLWTSLGTGISQVQRGAITVFNGTRGLPASQLSDVVRFQGRLFVLTQRGVYVLRPGNGGINPAHFERLGEPSLRPFKLIAHPKDLLMGYDHLLYRLDANDQPEVCARFEGRISRLYASTVDPLRVFVGFFADEAGTLRALRWQDGQWVPDGELPGVTDYIVRMAQLPDGTLWVGTAGKGLLRVTFPPGSGGVLAQAQVTRFTEAEGLPAGMGWPRMFRTNAGALVLIGTDGPYTFDEATRRFVRFTAWGPAFVDMSLLLATEDNRGTVWAAYLSDRKRPAHHHRLGRRRRGAGPGPRRRLA